MTPVLLYIAKTKPPNSIPVRYWRLLRLPGGREIGLTRIAKEAA